MLRRIRFLYFPLAALSYETEQAGETWAETEKRKRVEGLKSSSRKTRSQIFMEWFTCASHQKAHKLYSHLPPECFTLGMLDNKTRLFLQQLNCESVGNNHKHHRHIKRAERSEDEEHSIVDYALLWVRHNVLIVDDSCNTIWCQFILLVRRVCAKLTENGDRRWYQHREEPHQNNFKACQSFCWTLSRSQWIPYA